MSNIPIKSALDNSGAFFPESHERAITDDNGTTLESKLQMVKTPVLTLNSAPTSSTLTHTEGGVTYTFKVGDEVRVHDTEKGTAEGNYYVFYTLKDKSNNTAYWEESGSGGGVAMNTYTVLIDSNQVDKTDIANTELTYNSTAYSNGDTISVPSSTTITTADLSATSVNGYYANIEVVGMLIMVTYQTEILTVTITATDEVSGVSNCSITVTDGNSTTLGTLTNGQSLKIPYGVNYVCTPSAAPTDYVAPAVITKDWSDATAKSLTFTYIYGMVDLGLSVMWAKGNICKNGSSYYVGEPTDQGCYYSWGNIEGHNEGEGYSFDSTTYASTPGASITNSIASNDSAHDAALACLGTEFRLPTSAEFTELTDSCTLTWVTSYNGVTVSGYIFKSNIAGYTDKEIFIPASGYIGSTNISYKGSRIGLWSSTYNSGTYSFYWYGSSAGGKGVSSGVIANNQGLTIRAVR